MKKCLTNLLFLLFLVPKLVSAQFAKGADIGWLSQMEASNKKFYDKNGVQKDLLDILKEYDINAVRFRVWVNPSGNYCNKADVIKQAVRCKNKNFRIMIDFHYSDSWADPGQQTKPAAWNSYNITQLKAAVATHTTDVLTGLRDAGVYPEWVQVGNETNNGTLWPEGQASTNMANFAGIVASGYDAVKAVFPTTKAIVHISNGYDNALFRWMFDGLKNNNAKWDAIGMSLYPDQSLSTSTWQTYNPKCLTNLNDMVSRYGKDVLMSEIGMPWSDATTSFDFIKDILAKNRSVSRSLGVFYWEPECYNGWQGYQKGAFDNSGKPTHAMDAFLEGNTTANIAPTVSITSPANNATFSTFSNITISANASDNGGSISKVEFFNGVIKLGEDASNPYSFTISNATEGTYNITAVAWDNKGQITNSAVTKIFVSKLTSLENEETRNEFELSPNPFSENIKIRHNNEDFSYSILDLNGVLLESNANSIKEAIVGSKLKSGIYILKTSSNGVNRRVKIIKE